MRCTCASTRSASGSLADIDEAMRAQQRFDLLARAAAEERQLVADCGVFGAGAGILLAARLRAGDTVAAVEHGAVDDDEPPARSQHADPFVDRCLRVRQGPQHMTADREVEARRRERQLLGIALFEAHREPALGRLALGARDHRRGEIDAGDAMPAGGQFKAQKPSAAAEVERVERPRAGSTRPKMRSQAARSAAVRMLWPKSSSK